MHAPKSRHLARLLRDQSGGSAAEFALTLPILAILLIGTIDIAGMAWAKMQVAAAARAGASYALTNGFSVSGIDQAVTNATSLPVTSTTPTQTFGCPDAATGVTTVANGTTPCAGGALPGKYVTAGASGSYTLIFRWPGLTSPLSFSAQTKVRIP